MHTRHPLEVERERGIHGVDDDYVSIDNGELIYSNYSGPYKEAHRIDDAGHGNVPVIFGLENYLNVVLDFIRM